MGFCRTLIKIGRRYNKIPGPKTIRNLPCTCRVIIENFYFKHLLEVYFVKLPLSLSPTLSRLLAQTPAPTKVMALWYRVGSNRLRPVTLLLYTRLSVIPSTSPSPVVVNSSKPPPVGAASSLPFIQFRSFAAPVQVSLSLRHYSDFSFVIDNLGFLIWKLIVGQI